MQGDSFRILTMRQSDYPPLGAVTKPVLDTEATAYYLNLAPQTLRVWSSRENGLIRPIRIGRRLGWPVSEIKRVLGV